MLQFPVIWTAQQIFVIDFEGGLASGVVEYGVVGVRAGKIGEARTRICRPTGPVPPADVAIHGIEAGSLTLAATGPFSDDWEYFAGLRERGALAAHFAGVENALLRATWPVPRQSPDFAKSAIGNRQSAIQQTWGPWIDTARLAAHFFPNLLSKNLEAVVSALGLSKTLAELSVEICPPERRRYHCALHDALASALLLCALAADSRAASLGLREVFTLSTLDPKRRDDLVQEKLF